MRLIRKLLAALLVVALCLSAAAALAEGLIRTTGNVHLRKGAGLGYKSVCTIDKGTRLEYDKTKKDDRGVKWYRVTYKGRTGWVSSKYAKAADSSGDSKTDKKVKTTGKVHLRAGAGLNYRSLRTVPSGKTLSYDKTKKDGRGVVWYHVSYKGKSGWISSKYAKKK